MARYYFLSEGFVWKLRSFFPWGALSIERTGLQFAVQSLNDLSRAEPVTIVYSPIRDPPTIVYSPIRDPPTWRASFPYSYPPRTGAQPGTGFPLRRLLRFAEIWLRYLKPPPNWRARSQYIYPSGKRWSSPKSMTLCNRRSVKQDVLVSSQLGLRGLYLNEFWSDIRRGTLRRNL
jgi:hypothetical protein